MTYMNMFQLKSEKGRVYLIPSIARTELDDVIELIRTKCDLVHHGDEKTEIMTTGAGCNLFKAKLEEGLNIRYCAPETRYRSYHSIDFHCSQSNFQSWYDPLQFFLHIFTRAIIMTFSEGLERHYHRSFDACCAHKLHMLLLSWWRHQMEPISALLALCQRESTGYRWIPLTKVQ